MQKNFKKALSVFLGIILIAGMLGGYCIPAVAETAVTPMVSIGNEFAVALASDGTAYAWGNNTNGVFGNGTTTSSGTPVAVTMPDGIRFSAACAGADHVVALATNGTVWTWGQNGTGQLGVGEQPVKSTPNQVSGALNGKTVTAVAAGSGVSFAVTSDGNVYSWGSNSLGLLGDPSVSTMGGFLNTPQRITALDTCFVTDIAIGELTAAVLDSTGAVWFWGDNELYQLGTDTTDQLVTTPTQKTTSAGYQATGVALGANHSAVLMADGRIAGFGTNKYGVFGTANSDVDAATTVFKYADFTTGTKITSFAAGTQHMIALTDGGEVYTWGRNNSYQLGLASGGSQQKTPQKVTLPEGAAPVSVTAAYNTSAVVDSNGLVYMWGVDSSGGLLCESQTPTVVSGLSLGAPPKEIVKNTYITMTATIPAPTYTVTIPATVEVGELEQKSAAATDKIASADLRVSASDVKNLFGEKQIVVKISTEDGNFALYDGDYQLPYTVYNTETEGTALASGETYAVFTEDGVALGRIEVDQSQITREGEYSGRLIFTVSLEPIEGKE